MHEDYLQIVRNVFSSYADTEITNATMDDSLVKIYFKFQGFALTMYIFHPGNTYLRDILVCIEDQVAEELTLPPHYMRYDDERKLSALCLLDKGQYVLSTYSLTALVELYLDQIQSLLSLSPHRMEEEYIKEFEFYWNSACNTTDKIHIEAEVYLPTYLKATSLKCWYYQDKSNGKYLLVPDDVSLNSRHTPKGSLSSAVYIPIEVPEGIIPPKPNAPWDAHDILNIVYGQTTDRISPDSFTYLRNLQVDNYKKVVVFSFSYPNSVPITIVGIISFTNNERKDFISKIQENFYAFEPICSTRMDLQYLHERVGQNYTSPPAILLLGCGSVGSYILPELVNMGIVKIGLSDPDEFESGNAFRHHLGPYSHGQKKVSMMRFYMEYENPLVSIDMVPNLAGIDDQKLTQILKAYDIVIVAIGNTDLQRKLNYKFSKINSTSWFLYNWLDAEGKGSHVLAMRYSQKGCYNCLFFKNGQPSTQNKVSFTDGSERVIGNGCGGSFSPYGNNVLVRNTSLITSVLQSVMNGSIVQNTVVSIKNDFRTIESSITVMPTVDSNFAEERCDICGCI